MRVEKTAGVRHRKPHMTRHTFATDVLDATEGDLYAVKELLGHSSTQVTEVYLHSSRTRTGAPSGVQRVPSRNRQTEDSSNRLFAGGNRRVGAAPREPPPAPQ